MKLFTVRPAVGALAVLVSAAAFAIFGGTFASIGEGGTSGSGDATPGEAIVAPQRSAAWRRAAVAGIPPSFALEIAWEHPAYAAGLVRGDFNGDGKDDLAVVGCECDPRNGPAEVMLFLQSPAGTLGPATRVPFPRLILADLVTGAAAGDLNGDGRSDLVIATYAPTGNLMTLVSEPNGEFAWREDAWIDALPEWQPVLTDQDQDGHLDVIVTMFSRGGPPEDSESRLLVTWFGDGAGGFARRRFETTDDRESELLVGNLDGVAGPDLLVFRPGYDWPSLLRRNDGGGGWHPPLPLQPPKQETFGSAIVGDFTGDGRDDAAFLSGYPVHRMQLFPQQPDGSLATTPQRSALGPGGSFAHAADLDGNGGTDFVYWLWTPQPIAKFAIVLQDEHGLDVPAIVDVPVAPSGPWFTPRQVLSGDFNGDGVTDVAFASDQGEVKLWRGKLAPYLGPASLPGAPRVLLVQPGTDPLKGEAMVTLAAPVDSGGSAITGYTVYSSPGDAVDLDAGSPETVHRVEGMLAGGTYSFRARASNAAGKGPTSTSSAPVQAPDFSPNLFVMDGGLHEGDLGEQPTFVWFWLDQPAPAGGVHFTVATQDGTARAGSDYTAVPPTALVIPAGEQYGPLVEFSLHGDFDAEENETIQLLISDLVGATLPPPPPTLTIPNDDLANGLRVNLAGKAQAEGDAGATRMYLPMTLAAQRAADTTFEIHAESLGATEGIDFVLPFDTITVPAGQTSAQVAIDILGDSVVEHDEDFQVFVVGPGGSPDAYGAWPTILNDEPMPTVSVSDAAVTEGDDGSREMRFTATLSAPMPDDAWFRARTAAGTATPGEDYQDRVFSALYIPAGETTLDIAVPVIGDRRHEASETVGLFLFGGPERVAIGDNLGTGLIQDDDAAATVSVLSASRAEGNGIGSMRFTVELSAPLATQVEFKARTFDGTAFAGSDYSAVALDALVIPAGQTQVFVDVPILGDSVPEDTESFGVEVYELTGAAAGRVRWISQLINDDLPLLSIADASGLEGSGPGWNTLSFEVTLSAPSTVPIRFWLARRLTGSAEADDVQNASAEGYRIDAGRTRFSVPFRVTPDTLTEPNEVFELVLTSVYGAVIGDGAAVGTVVDDDPASAVGHRAAEAKNRALRNRIACTAPQVAPSRPRMSIACDAVRGSTLAR